MNSYSPPGAVLGTRYASSGYDPWCPEEARQPREDGVTVSRSRGSSGQSHELNPGLLVLKCVLDPHTVLPLIPPVRPATSLPALSPARTPQREDCKAPQDL